MRLDDEVRGEELAVQIWELKGREANQEGNSFWKKLVVVQSLSHVQIFVTPWTGAHQAPLTSTISQNLLKFKPTDLVMLSNHLFLYFSLLFLPSIFPSIRAFSNESALRIRWPKYWFQLPLEWTGWISLKPKGLSRVFSNTTVQKHQFFSAQLSLQPNSHIHM